jgi:hypothetical protein
MLPREGSEGILHLQFRSQQPDDPVMQCSAEDGEPDRAGGDGPNLLSDERTLMSDQKTATPVLGAVSSSAACMWDFIASCIAWLDQDVTVMALSHLLEVRGRRQL